MASEPWVVCGAQKLRFNRLLWGLLKAHEQNLLGGEITKLNPVLVMYQLWTDVISVASFKVWPHRRWLNSWFTENTEESAFYGKWMRLLDYLEHQEWRFINVQLVPAGNIVTFRLLQGLRPPDSVPLAVVVGSCLVTTLFTPPKSNPYCDRQMHNSFIDILHRTRRQQATRKERQGLRSVWSARAV